MPVPSKRFSVTLRISRIFRLIAFFAFILFAINGCIVFYSPGLILSLRKEKDFSTRCCGPGCRHSLNETADNITAHYDNDYFQWQTRLGREKAAVRDWNRFFQVKATDTVADLGAGGGHILATLKVSRRIAVEINPIARASIHANYPEQIQTFTYPEEVPDNSVDVLYSTSAIEHFECPLTELREMARKVRKGGHVVSCFSALLA
ncbi:3-demethylubiquinone-9 3-o-methyltransferase [Gracilaria domingensis]|nr:3-demethylubiquinone-9 3-o-methyltransferase [Gracilaria domingensis]